MGLEIRQGMQGSLTEFITWEVSEVICTVMAEGLSEISKA